MTDEPRTTPAAVEGARGASFAAGAPNTSSPVPRLNSPKSKGGSSSGGTSERRSEEGPAARRVGDGEGPGAPATGEDSGAPWAAAREGLDVGVTMPREERARAGMHTSTLPDPEWCGRRGGAEAGGAAAGEATGAGVAAGTEAAGSGESSSGTLAIMISPRLRPGIASGPLESSTSSSWSRGKVNGVLPACDGSNWESAALSCSGRPTSRRA